MLASSHFHWSRRRLIVAFVGLAVTGTAAGAATVHQLTVKQGSGSGGATTFYQTSASGSALQGEVASTPNTSIKIPFGVLGEYDATGGSPFGGIGTIGISTTGYGVGAEALGANPAILALAGGNGDALDADVAAHGTGVALSALSNNNFGVLGVANTGTGVVGASKTSSGGLGALGSPGGAGVIANGYSGTATEPALISIGVIPGTDLIGGYTYNSSTNATFQTFAVQAGTANRSGVTLPGGTDTQISGDLYVVGHVYEGCQAFPAVSSTVCTDVAQGSTGTSVGRTAGGAAVQMHGSRQNSSTVEDFGESRLTGGAAYVRLNPAFAHTISTASPYLVFVTPHGDSRGLYVTDSTPGGFEVRENGQGRSTLSFDYRIVATPNGTSTGLAPTVAKTRTVGSNRQLSALVAEFAKVRAHQRSSRQSLIRDLFTGAKLRLQPR